MKRVRYMHVCQNSVRMQRLLQDRHNLEFIPVNIPNGKPLRYLCF